MIKFIRPLLCLLLLGFSTIFGTIICFAQPSNPVGYARIYPIDEALKKRKAGLQDKIVGGRDAAIGEFPWQVSIRFINKDYQEGIHFCGGALLSDNWVLTATHCFDRAPDALGNITRAKKSEIIVAAGGVSVDGLSHKSKVTKIVGHEPFRGPFLGGDIALLKLDQSLETPNSTATIMPAKKDIQLSHGRGMDITGWGFTSGTSKAEKLQVLDNFPVVGNNLCAVSLGLSDELASRLLCAGRPRGTQAACRGDSGGPMAVMTADGPQLVGIISFRPDQSACERPQRYTIATRVSEFNKWIVDNKK